MVQKILRIYLENRDSTSDRLEQLACTILPEVHIFVMDLGLLRVLVDTIFLNLFKFCIEELVLKVLGV